MWQNNDLWSSFNSPSDCEGQSFDCSSEELAVFRPITAGGMELLPELRHQGSEQAVDGEISYGFCIRLALLEFDCMLANPLYKWYISWFINRYNRGPPHKHRVQGHGKKGKIFEIICKYCYHCNKNSRRLKFPQLNVSEKYSRQRGSACIQIWKALISTLFEILDW